MRKSSKVNQVNPVNQVNKSEGACMSQFETLKKRPDAIKYKIF